ncbi:hypothetical protein QBC34DRAFT_220693 [Podospora aff. communis PSN243]|uniref:Uncharacterized protein n=1 Tax=Podospora aff. communis PSN243 TaxID=3040156 RepID=A0AAV9GYF2_9PEZI|nr:hypothetical protein QBC34DRAFT_220693 [Podospora aff. communis PSN243]
MADRHPTRPPPGGVSKTSSRAAPSTSSASASTNVRRNLFQSQLTRRPTAGSVSSSAGSAETLRLDPDVQLQPPGGGGGSVGVGNLDIVIRDKNGEIEIGDPPTPVIEAEEVGVDAGVEGERERRRLAEAVKQHQIGQNSIPAQPEELLEAVRASLRAKVAALAEDNWMFEREELSRHQ